MNTATLDLDFYRKFEENCETELLKKAKFFGWSYGQWCGAMWYLRQLPEDVTQAIDMLRWFREHNIQPEDHCLPEAEAYAGKAVIHLMKTAERSLRMATDGTKSLLGDPPPAFDLHRFRHGSTFTQ